MYFVAVIIVYCCVVVVIVVHTVHNSTFYVIKLLKVTHQSAASLHFNFK